MVGGNGKIQWLGDAGAAKAAWIFWGIFALVLCIIVAVQPDRRTVTPEYRKASEKWWASQPGIYTGKSGFLYLPQAAIFYTPIRILPQRVGEPLWRLVMLGSLAGALWWGAKTEGGCFCLRVFWCCRPHSRARGMAR